MNTPPIPEQRTVEARIYHLDRPASESVSGLAIIFILDGQVRVSTEGMMRVLAPADILTLAHLRRFRIAPASDCFFLEVRMSHAFLSSAFGKNIPSFDCDTTRKTGRDFAFLRGLLADIAYSDAIEVGVGKGLLLRSRLYRLLDELDKNFRRVDEDGEEGRGETGRRRNAIRTFMRDNFRSPLTLAYLAESLSLTPQYLSKYFKKQLGVNFHDYLSDLRTESALKDLAFTDATVTTISFDNGFPNLTAFLDAVKRKTGLSPTAYRKAHGLRKDERNAPFEAPTPKDLARVKEMVIPYVEEKSAANLSAQRKRLDLTIDATIGGSYERPWKEVINLGFAPDFIKSDFLEQIALIQKEIRFTYARFQGLFGKSMVMAKEATPEHGFAKLDKLIDFLYGVGLVPFIELGFKPEKISKNTSNHLFYKDSELSSMPLDEFDKLLGDFLRHAINRYGASEVGKWRFEFWAECDEQLRYDEEALPRYVEHFTRIQKTIKATSPDSLLGGPGFNAGADIRALTGILRQLADRDCVPDFLSFYLFSFISLPTSIHGEGDDAILWAKNETMEKIGWIRDSAKAHCPDLSHFCATEWNLDFSCRNRVHDSLLKAPFIIQNAIDGIGNVDSLAYWLASDISAEYDDSDAVLFGGAGLLSRFGIRKPAFYAYDFLSRLGDRLIAKGPGYIVTAKSSVEFVAILFNYKYLNDLSRLRDEYRDLSGDITRYLENLDELLVSLALTGVQPGRYKIRQRILSTRHGSVLDAWKRLSSIEDLHRSEVGWLDRVCVPALKIDFVDCLGPLKIECRLEPNEVRLFEISLFFN